MLGDVKDKRGWPTLFAEGARACAGLQRLHESIECHSAPQAGRGLYADFLDDAARTLDAPHLARAAAAYREAGALWTAIADLVAHCDDATVRKVCTAADTRLEDEDTSGDAASRSCVDRVQELQTIAAGCKLTKDAARGLTWRSRRS